MGKALGIATGALEIAGGIAIGVMTGNVYLAAQLVMAGISTEINALDGARATSITTRTPASPRQIIYGEQRIGGVMVYESTTGSEYDQYNQVIVIATHEVDSIVNLYLDGRQVFWQVGSAGNSTRNGVNFGGQAAQHNAAGNTTIGPGGQNYNFNTLVYCEARYGDQQPGDVIAGLTANDPNWTTSAAGSPYLGGVCYVYLKVEYDASQFPQMPEVKFTVRGKNNIYDPRIAGTPTPVLLQRPAVTSNGWAANAQEAAYEGNVDQGYGWGLNSDATPGYTNPANAVDGDETTAATCIVQHTHQYNGCIWSFSALTGTAPTSLYLNVNSSVPPITGAARSAGIWYTVDGGTNWTQIYNIGVRTQQWDSVALSPTQDCSQVQVMAFQDAHDDMNHNVYDIQLSTGAMNTVAQTGFTSNWALVVGDVLSDPVWGLGDGASINQEQFIAAANVCDEQIALAIGGTESQWSCNYHYTTSTSPGDVLQTMMFAAAGRLSRIGGEWFIFPAYWQGPTFAFDQTAFTGKVEWKPFRKYRDLFNRVNGTYIAPNVPWNIAGDLYDANGWYYGTIQNNFPFAFQPTNYPQYAMDQLHGYAEDVFLAQDHNEVLPKEITQSCVLSISQAQRAAKIYLMRNRYQGEGTFPMNLNAWQMQPCDVMTMTFPAYGWANKQLEITGTTTSVEVDDQGGVPIPVIKFQCTVAETDQSVYEWNLSDDLSPYDVPYNPTQGVPYTVGVVTNLNLVSSASTALIGADGTVTPRIYATWNAPLDSTVTQLAIQYQVAGSSTWQDYGIVPVSTTSAYISGVVAGQTYNVQIQSIRSNGAVSTWVEATGCLVVAPNSTVNTYTLNPAIDLTNPTATTIAMGAAACTFGNATVNYSARTFTIPTPTAPTWYYVTIADPTQQGETSATLTATCQTSNALLGVQGNTYIGSIQVTPAGGSNNATAGGWPAPPTFIVGD